MVVALVVVGAACGGDGADMAVDELAGRAFVSSSVTDADKPLALAPGTRLSIRFGDDRWLSATAGCNEMGARVKTVGDGQLSLEDDSMNTTAMLCPDLTVQEDWFGRLLGAEPSIDVTPGRLVLADGDRRVEFTEHVLDTKATLVGPTWVVAAIVTGGEAKLVPAEPRREVVFEDDGRFTSRAGCAEVSGTLEYERGTIRIGSGGVGGCGGTGDDPWLGVESGRMTVERAGDTVRLRSDRGGGVDLRRV